jgi:transcription elongation factor Elf1
MFEDETVDIACPNCGHRNSVLVRDVEARAESHIVCNRCKVGVKIEAKGFQQRLDEVRRELEEIERAARKESKAAQSRRTKDDYEI